MSLVEDVEGVLDQSREAFIDQATLLGHALQGVALLRGGDEVISVIVCSFYRA